MMVEFRKVGEIVYAKFDKDDRCHICSKKVFDGCECGWV
jgi:hypothetical protein